MSGGSAGGASGGSAGAGGGSVADAGVLIDVRRVVPGASLAPLLQAPPTAATVRLEFVAGVHELDTPIDVPATWCGPGRRVELWGLDGGAVLSGGRQLSPLGFTTSSFPGAFAHALPSGVGPPRDLYRSNAGLVRATWPDGPTPQLLAPSVSRWNYSTFNGTPVQHVVAARAQVPPWIATGAPSDGLELVLPMGWSVSRIPVTGFFTEPAFAWFGLDVAAGRTEALKSRDQMTFLPPAPNAFGPFHAGVQRFRLENHPSFLTQNGEWIAANGHVHVMAVAPPTDVVLPVLERLLTARGCSVDLRNLTFANTTWRGAAAGFIGANAHTFWDSAPDAGLFQREVPAGVEFVDSDVQATDVAFVQLGQVALEVRGGSVALERTRFERIGCTGLRAVTPRVTVRHSDFVDIGADFACQGISAVGSSLLSIEQSRFRRVGAAAVYVFGGFFTTPPDPLAPAGVLPDGGAARRISWNAFEAASNLVTDTAAIHVGGDGLVIQGNTFRAIRKPGWNVGGGFSSGVYLDIGSSRTQVRDNWFDDLDLPVQLNCHWGTTLSGNDAGSFGVDGGGRFLNSSYASCLLFQPADGGGPTWQPLLAAMRDAGCATDDGGRLLTDAFGFEQCPCNALERRDCAL